MADPEDLLRRARALRERSQEKLREALDELEEELDTIFSEDDN